MDTDAYKERQRELWSKGDWRLMHDRTQAASTQLVTSVGIRPQELVLEVASGTGNGAIAAAKAGGIVTASDLSGVMVSRGRSRTEAEGLQIEWFEADMENLPVGDASFDVVISCFGTLFVPRPEGALRELFRVLKPGGRLGIANWVRDGWQKTMFDIVARYLPPDEDRPDSFAWGDEDQVGAWMQTHAATVSFEHHLAWSAFDSPEAWWEASSQNAPMLIAASEALDAQRFQDLGQEMVAAIRAVSEPGPTTRWASPYLIAVATKK